MKIYEDLDQIDRVLKISDHSVREWIGFNYGEYLDEVIAWVDKHGFEDAEDLSMIQIKAMRKELIQSFKKGESIRTISRKLLSAGLKDLEVTIPPKTDEEGNIIRQGYNRVIPKEFRAEILARTETIKAANEGALDNYEKNMVVERVQWIAAISDRTCDECASMNGQIFELKNAHGLIPRHCACRCCFAPITGD